MKDILYDWNPWWVGPETLKDLSGIPRSWYLDQIREQLELRHIITITGIRRSGKTTLMYQAISHLLEKISPGDILFINADDERMIALEDPLETMITEYLRTIKKDPNVMTYVFIDEIQSIVGWERVVKRYYDLRKKMKFIVSGSSSSLISSDFSTLLTGRSISLKVFPLSFREFLQFRSVDHVVDDLEGTWVHNRDRRDHIIGHLDDHMKIGGFPEIVTSEGGREVLEEYFRAIIYRDILTRYHIREPRVLELLAVYSLRNLSNLLSMRSVAQASGISPDTASEYLSLLEKAFLVHTSRRFEHSTKAHLNTRSPVKIYATDLGMANSLMLEPMSLKGRWAENILANELERRYGTVSYWRGKREVDLIIPMEHIAFQVCYGPIRKNELTAFSEAPLGGYRKMIVTMDEFDPDARIPRFPLWTLLLSSSWDW